MSRLTAVGLILSGIWIAPHAPAWVGLTVGAIYFLCFALSAHTDSAGRMLEREPLGSPNAGDE